MRWQLVGVVLAGFLVFDTLPAAAHVPVFVDSPTIETAYQIDDVTYQTGLYGTIAYPGAVQYYRLDLGDPRMVSLFLLVPNSSGCRDFRPQLAVIGSAVGEMTSHDLVVVPDGMSVLSASSPFWGRFIDADTRLPYFAGPRLYPELEAGTYYLAVYDGTGGVGNFMLLTGDLDSVASDPAWIADAELHHACGV